MTVRPNDRRELRVGQALNVSCYVNQPLSYILDHSVDFYQINTWTDDSRMLFINKQRQSVAEPDYYDISFVAEGETMLFTLMVKERK